MITVKLGPNRASFVEQRIAAGQFASAEDVVDEALRLMENNEEERATDRASVIAKLEAGLQSIERGDWVDGEEFFAKMEIELQTHLHNGHR